MKLQMDCGFSKLSKAREIVQDADVCESGNINNFFKAVTPQIPFYCSDVEDDESYYYMCDLWEFYDMPYGFEIILQQPPPVYLEPHPLPFRPEFEVHYTPHLSGIQLFSPPRVSAGQTEVHSMLYEWFSDEQPDSRAPLPDQIAGIATSFPEITGKTKNTEFSDKSWFSVTWFPLLFHPTTSNRIRGQFITYHLIRPSSPDKFVVEVNDVHWTSASFSRSDMKCSTPRILRNLKDAETQTLENTHTPTTPQQVSTSTSTSPTSLNNSPFSPSTKVTNRGTNPHMTLVDSPLSQSLSNNILESNLLNDPNTALLVQQLDRTASTPLKTPPPHIPSGATDVRKLLATIHPFMQEGIESECVDSPEQREAGAGSFEKDTPTPTSVGHLTPTAQILPQAVNSEYDNNVVGGLPQLPVALFHDTNAISNYDSTSPQQPFISELPIRQPTTPIPLENIVNPYHNTQEIQDYDHPVPLDRALQEDSEQTPQGTEELQSHNNSADSSIVGMMNTTTTTMANDAIMPISVAQDAVVGNTNADLLQATNLAAISAASGAYLAGGGVPNMYSEAQLLQQINFNINPNNSNNNTQPQNSIASHNPANPFAVVGAVHMGGAIAVAQGQAGTQGGVSYDSTSTSYERISGAPHSTLYSTNNVNYIPTPSLPSTFCIPATLTAPSGATIPTLTFEIPSKQDFKSTLEVNTDLCTKLLSLYIQPSITASLEGVGSAGKVGSNPLCTVSTDVLADWLAEVTNEAARRTYNRKIAEVLAANAATVGAGEGRSDSNCQTIDHPQQQAQQPTVSALYSTALLWQDNEPRETDNTMSQQHLHGFSNGVVEPTDLQQHQKLSAQVEEAMNSEPALFLGIDVPPQQQTMTQPLLIDPAAVHSATHSSGSEGHNTPQSSDSEGSQATSECSLADAPSDINNDLQLSSGAREDTPSPTTPFAAPLSHPPIPPEAPILGASGTMVESYAAVVSHNAESPGKQKPSNSNTPSPTHSPTHNKQKGTDVPELETTPQRDMKTSISIKGPPSVLNNDNPQVTTGGRAREDVFEEVMEACLQLQHQHASTQQHPPTQQPEQYIGCVPLFGFIPYKIRNDTWFARHPSRTFGETEQEIYMAPLRLILTVSKMLKATGARHHDYSHAIRNCNNISEMLEQCA